MKIKQYEDITEIYPLSEKWTITNECNSISKVIYKPKHKSTNWLEDRISDLRHTYYLTLSRKHIK